MIYDIFILGKYGERKLAEIASTKEPSEELSLYLKNKGLAVFRREESEELAQYEMYMRSNDGLVCWREGDLRACIEKDIYQVREHDKSVPVHGKPKEVTMLESELEAIKKERFNAGYNEAIRQSNISTEEKLHF